MPPDLQQFMLDYERRHAELEKTVSVLRAEFNGHLDLPSHPDAKIRIEKTEAALYTLTLDYTKFKAQIVAYSAIGAFVGGGIFEVLINLIGKKIIP